MKLARFRSALARKLKASRTFGRLKHLAPDGVKRAARRLISVVPGRTSEEPSYAAWLARERSLVPSSETARSRLSSLRRRPLVSVIMPVHDPELTHLELALRSVETQLYPNWELCIADDASSRREIRRFLEECGGRDRVRLVRLERQGHIAGATNAALGLATGEFCAFLDHDDELSSDALLEVAEALDRSPDLDVVYSDHDIVGSDGRRRSPRFKPDWSPELLLSHMYLGHLKVYRTRLLRELSGMREGFEGSADYDLALRLTERTDRIHHIPRILYHWRAVPTSMATTGGIKSYSYESGRRALEETLRRRGIAAEAVHPPFARKLDIGMYQLDFTGTGNTEVTIVIPTRDRVELLAACIRSIEEKTTHGEYRILIVNNESHEAETLDYLSRTPHRVVEFANEGRFNFAAMNNFAVSQIDTEYFVLLNNDTLVVTPRWLEGLLGFGRMPQVGAVGAKLLYPGGRIQHAGVVMGVQGLTGHALQPLSDETAPWEYSRSPRNYLAVTAACMLSRKSLFNEVGGLDADHLQVAWNDVDYCLRLRERGYRAVVHPDVVLLHLESQSRGDDKNPAEVAYMKSRWARYVGDDPYFNPNFSRLAGDFRIKTDPEEDRFFFYR